MNQRQKRVYKYIEEADEILRSLMKDKKFYFNNDDFVLLHIAEMIQKEEEHYNDQNILKVPSEREFDITVDDGDWVRHTLIYAKDELEAVQKVKDCLTGSFEIVSIAEVREKKVN